MMGKTAFTLVINCGATSGTETDFAGTTETALVRLPAGAGVRPAAPGLALSGPHGPGDSATVRKPAARPWPAEQF